MSDWEDDQPVKTNATTQNNNTAYNIKKYAPNTDAWDTSDPRQNSSRASYASSNKDDNGDRSFELDQRYVGIVIGRGGSNIREVEQRFNVRMKIGEYLTNSILSYASTHYWVFIRCNLIFQIKMLDEMAIQLSTSMDSHAM